MRRLIPLIESSVFALSMLAFLMIADWVDRAEHERHDGLYENGEIHPAMQLPTYPDHADPERHLVQT